MLNFFVKNDFRGLETRNQEQKKAQNYAKFQKSQLLGFRIKIHY